MSKTTMARQQNFEVISDMFKIEYAHK